MSGAKENQLKPSERTDSSEVDDITSLDDMHTQLDCEVNYKLINSPVVSSEAAPVCFLMFCKRNHSAEYNYQIRCIVMEHSLCVI